jgi:hypothetical protein
LTGRSQTGRAMSKPREVESGVPQGGILSTIIFIIYVADLGECTKYSDIFTCMSRERTKMKTNSKEKQK